MSTMIDLIKVVIKSDDCGGKHVDYDRVAEVDEGIEK